MTKSYYVEQNGYFDPKIVFLDVDAETFTLQLYEKLYDFMSTDKEISEDSRISVCNVEVLLSTVLDKLPGICNYEIKDLTIYEIKDVSPIKFGEMSDKLFFIEKREYLPETEDDFDIKFIPVACKSKEDFMKLFKESCEKSFKKKDYKVELNGLSFYADDVYSVDKNKKMTIYYPKLTEVV